MPDLVPLDRAHCLAGRGHEHRLSEAQVRELLPQVAGWELAEDGKALVRSFAFEDYYRTMSYVNALAHMANRENHHPDLAVHYDRCVVRYSTHDAGGLTENDFICAARASALAG
jgi:4a-hydroxytetrahydrobiopterin dehydratase